MYSRYILLSALLVIGAETYNNLKTSAVHVNIESDSSKVIPISIGVEVFFGVKVRLHLSLIHILFLRI